MGNSKFVIDGKIEGKPESIYLRKKKAEKSKGLRGWFIILSILLFLFIAATFILFIENMEANATINSMKETNVQAEKLIKKNKEYQIENATLQKRIIKLKLENEILLQGSENLDGIFFEVQIGNFSDFTLDAYKDELQALHEDKTMKGSKFCLGRFRSFQKAMLFENDIKKMGITNAFIVGRIDGKLVDYQDALKAYHQNQEIEK